MAEALRGAWARTRVGKRSLPRSWRCARRTWAPHNLGCRFQIVTSGGSAKKSAAICRGVAQPLWDQVLHRRAMVVGLSMPRG